VEEQVTVRTLSSDLALMGQGARPSVQNIPAIVIGAPAPPSPGRKLAWVWLLAGGVGVLVLFFAGYYLLPLLFSGRSPAPAPAVNPAPAANPPAGLPTSTAASFTHQSFFRRSPDRNLTLNLASPGLPQTYVQNLQTQLAGVSASSSFLEIYLAGANGSPPGWNQFAEGLGAKLFTPDFWQNNFQPDFTFFVYRDKSGAWPGYVLKLQPSASVLVLQGSLLGMEPATSSLANLFLSAAGTPVGGFADAQIANQLVRSLSYSEPGANLVYGLVFNQYLILSTSLDGYKQALSRL